MKEIKNIFVTLKSWWDNPRLKGVVQLIFWIIFFFIVALMFRSGKKTDEITKNSVNNKDEQTITTGNEVISYEYEYKYIDDTNNVIITGIHYNDKEKFTLNNIKYYSIEDKYYDEISNTETDISLSIDEWSYNKIKYITDHNPYSNLIKYKNGEEKYEYNIDKDTYNSYYGRIYPSNIIISITKDKNTISEAIVNYGFGSVDIKYTNINEIDSLDINVD